MDRKTLPIFIILKHHFLYFLHNIQYAQNFQDLITSHEIKFVIISHSVNVCFRKKIQSVKPYYRVKSTDCHLKIPESHGCSVGWMGSVKLYFCSSTTFLWFVCPKQCFTVATYDLATSQHAIRRDAKQKLLNVSSRSSSVIFFQCRYSPVHCFQRYFFLRVHIL